MVPPHNDDTVDIPRRTAVAQAAAGLESARVTVEFGALSHRGHVRETNEDSFLVSRAVRTLEALLTNLAETELPRQ